MDALEARLSGVGLTCSPTRIDAPLGGIDAFDALELCSFDRWYPVLKAVTIKSVVIPLTDEFVQHILADGVFETDGAADGSDDEEIAGDDGDEWSAAEQHTSFPELEQTIEGALTKFGGAAFVKLNWSAPKDAAWLLGGNLKCVSAKDVITLLQSSDHIAHDLCEARRACSSEEPAAGTADAAAPTDPWRGHPWFLVLRKWSNLRSSNEFRCFSVGESVVPLQQAQQQVQK